MDKDKIKQEIENPNSNQNCGATDKSANSVSVAVRFIANNGNFKLKLASFKSATAKCTRNCRKCGHLRLPDTRRATDHDRTRQVLHLRFCITCNPKKPKFFQTTCLVSTLTSKASTMRAFTDLCRALLRDTMQLCSLMDK